MRDRNDWDAALRGMQIAFLVVLSVLVLDVTRRVGPLLTDADYAVQNANRAIYAVGSETATEEKLIQKQTKAVSGTTARINALVDSARPVLAGLAADESSLKATADAATGLVANANDTIIPKAGADLDALGQTESQATATLNSLSLSAKRLATVTAALAESAPPILKSTQTVAENAATTTANVAASTGDVRAWIHRETTPARGFWNIVKAIIAPLGTVASIWKLI